MKRNRLFISTSANNINADSALPDFMQTNAEDSDSSKTWREVVAIHGAAHQGETNAFFPLIRPKAQNGFVNRGGDDDLTLGEAMKKGLAPQGMKPTWSPEARKRYAGIKKFSSIMPKLARSKGAGDTLDYRACFGIGLYLKT